MGAVVVFESMFGNTEAVARAVADGIAAVMPVEVVEVGAAPPLDALGADLLVVGAPTHAFGLSRASTRADAGTRTGRTLVSQGSGVREWLDAGSRLTLPVAAFDTHVRTPNLPGRAGSAAHKRLKRLGGRPLTKPATFWVSGLEGPLVDGELERARRWGAELAAVASAAAGSAGSR